ncbi:hypothetical protein [Nocardia sp. CA-145437]|uniref:hypothetical protein n=1 Tax=Nocardia sp. CA-145437 TaxID=3239980 RepID=UPI003D985548
MLRTVGHDVDFGDGHAIQTDIRVGVAAIEGDPNRFVARGAFDFSAGRAAETARELFEGVGLLLMSQQ